MCFGKTRGQTKWMKTRKIKLVTHKMSYLKCHAHLNSPYPIITGKRREIMRIALASQGRQELAESLETITANAISTPHLHFSQII